MEMFPSTGTTRRGVIAGVLGAPLLWGAAPAHAQDYPSRPIRIVSPFATGTAGDILGRVTAQRLAQHLGGVLTDGLDRGAARFGTAPERLSPGAVAEWAERAGVRVVLTPEAPAGWTADTLGPIEKDLGARGIRLQRLRRDWDDACWPLATRGFFQFRVQIPEIARRLAA